MLGAVIGVVAVSAVAAFIALAYRRGWRWAGLSADAGDGTPTAPSRPAKTLWDWLQLLIIPVVLALGAFALNATQAAREGKREDRRATREQAIAADRAREDTLRVYLQQMSDLITQHGLRRAQGGTPTLARTLTLIALRRLDRARKGLVVQFLLEERLITSTTEWTQTPRVTRGTRMGDGLVDLSGADLRRIDLRGVSLVTDIADDPETGHELTVAADLHSVDLRHADLRGTSLVVLC